MLRLKGESDLYMKRSPPKIIHYTNEPLKVKNASLERLKAEHGVISEQNRKSIEIDINYRSPEKDIHMASRVKKGQKSDLGNLLKNQNS